MSWQKLSIFILLIASTMASLSLQDSQAEMDMVVTLRIPHFANSITEVMGKRTQLVVMRAVNPTRAQQKHTQKISSRRLVKQAKRV
jgi:orotate phosphoribosyltransferase-like protein